MIDNLQLFGYIAAFFSIFSYVPYVKDIFHGKAKPERASWFIWAVLVTIQFFSQLSKGATYSLGLSGSQLFGITLIFFLSIKFGYGKLGIKDYVALLIAAIGLIIWYFTHDATTALVITIGIDSIGSLLTIDKAYKDPLSEPLPMWVMNLFAGVFASLAVGKLDVVLLLYPFYTIALNVGVIGAVFLGSRRQVKINVLK